MTSDAFDRRFAVFLQWGVTVLAKNLAAQVRPLQLESCSRMVEIDGVQFCDPGIPAFVFGVTFLARFIFLHQAMQTMFPGDVFRDLLVTVLAQPGLCRLVIRLVAVSAIALVFVMRLDQLARHQQVACRICMGLEGKYEDAHGNCERPER